MSLYFKTAMKCDHRPLHVHLFNTDRAFKALQDRESELLSNRNQSALTSSFRVVVIEEPPRESNNNNNTISKRSPSPSPVASPQILKKQTSFSKMHSSTSVNDHNVPSFNFAVPLVEINTVDDDDDDDDDCDENPSKQHQLHNSTKTSKNASVVAVTTTFTTTTTTTTPTNQRKFVDTLRYGVRSVSGIFSNKKNHDDANNGDETEQKIQGSNHSTSVTIAPTKTAVISRSGSVSNAEVFPPNDNNRLRDNSQARSGSTMNRNNFSESSKSITRNGHPSEHCAPSEIPATSSPSSSPKSQSAAKCFQLFENVRKFSHELEDATQEKFRKLHREAENDFKTNRFKTDVAVRRVSIPHVVSDESNVILSTLVQGKRMHQEKRLQEVRKQAKMERRMRRRMMRMVEDQEHGLPPSASTTEADDDDDESDDDRDANGKLKLKIGLSNADRTLEANFVDGNELLGDDDDGGGEGVNNRQWNEYIQRSGKSCDHHRSEREMENLQKLETVRSTVRNSMYGQIAENNKVRREDLSYKLMWRTIEQGGQLLLTPEERKERKQLAEMSSIALKRMMRDRKKKEKEDAIKKKDLKI